MISGTATNMAATYPADRNRKSKRPTVASTAATPSYWLSGIRNLRRCTVNIGVLAAMTQQVIHQHNRQHCFGNRHQREFPHTGRGDPW